MENRYKIIINNNSLYKEIELNDKMEIVKVGTTIDCNFRMHKELFFEPIELIFSRNEKQWELQCADNLYITTGDIRKLITKKLYHGDSLELKYQGSNNKVFNIDFLIDFDSGRKRYERIIDLSNQKQFCIGGLDDCAIKIKSEYITDDQILFQKKGSSFNAQIRNSMYGMYHNGKKVSDEVEIKSGDFFSICEFSFYYKNEKLWTEIGDRLYINGMDYIDLPEINTYPKFSRNIRLKILNDESEIEILDPPTIPKKPKNNLVMKLLPPLGMLLASGIMAIYGGAMIIFSVISGGMAIFTTVVGMKEGKKDYKKNMLDRTQKYQAYIKSKEEEIKQKRLEEKNILEEIFVPQTVIEKRFKDFSYELFDRSIGDCDFLCIRLGSGEIEAKSKIKYKKQEKLEVEDALQQEPKRLYDEYKYIKDAPIICDLKDVNAIGISGKIEYRFEFLKNIVIDLISRQYYTDMKMVFIAEENHKDQIYWLRMLPHVYNEQIKSRMMVCNDESRNYIFEYLYKELSSREQRKTFSEYIVVFFYDDYGLKNHPISKFIDKAKKLGITFIFFSESKNLIPIGCDFLIDIKDKHCANYIDCQDKRISRMFQYPHMLDEKANEIIRIMAPVYSEEISLEASLTKNISMFELLNIFTVDDLNLQERWNASKVYSSMAAPIGVSKTGLVELDLHDKAHGPHGLVAGTTGSGKSEILQTYILAMATLFHPYEIGFLIIDFKGGGMVNQFKKLPHLLGAITNIDGKEINRSLKSLKAELQKRQRLFADADVNHIDKYIKKFKKGEVRTPLPHLIIIVDEFAELKAEQPEFMKELISAARIGRSLGVHLILATQKPSGQVNEQIWSNSRFKLCLKVQSQEDSNEVIKSPLAAEIKEPGRAYLQVGNNEIFELFQSAYSGAPEKVDDNTIREFTIYQISSSGKRVPVYIQKKKKTEGENITQLDALVNYIHKYSKEANITKIANICLPPLPDYIVIPDGFDDYTIDSLTLGIYDNPDSQFQGTAKFNLCEENLMIIGASLTGKTNILQNIIRLVSEKYSPKEAVFYIADFGSMYLKNFETLHHVGGVVTISENEKVKNLFKLLTNEIQTRKNKFLEYGISSFSAYRDAGYQDLPQIFLMIDNFSAFKELYADAYEDKFVYLTREGISYGITVIITNAMTAGLGYKYMSNFASRIAFKCNDINEYSTIFDRCRLEPKDVPGRLLCKLDKELYEMQSFIAFEGEKEIQRSYAVKKFVASINDRYPNIYAKKIPEVPEMLTFNYLEQNYDINLNKSQYPFALDYANVDLMTLDLKAMNELCIIGRDTNKKLSVANSILSAIHHYILFKPVSLYIIDSVERPLKAKSDMSYVENYTIDYSEIGSIFDHLLPDLEYRYDLLMNGELEKLAKFPLIILFINNKDAIDYIAGTKELLNCYMKIVKNYKSLGVSFIFSDIDDIVVGYNGNDLLKRFKELKKAIITSNLAEFKFCDIPSTAIRNNKEANAGDSFLLDGSDIIRIKIAKEEV